MSMYLYAYVYILHFLPARKKLDLHTNIVCCKSFPGVETRHTFVDIVLIRENTEGEYSSLEHEVKLQVTFSLLYLVYNI